MDHGFKLNFVCECVIVKISTRLHNSKYTLSVSITLHTAIYRIVLNTILSCLAKHLNICLTQVVTQQCFSTQYKYSLHRELNYYNQLL